MTLQIDGIHITRTLLPGKFFVLNIMYGVFIGGQGEFHELFLGEHITLTYISYSSIINILESQQDYTYELCMLYFLLREFLSRFLIA